MDTALIARQPIFDTRDNVFAYELLFRDSMENRAEILDNRQATCTVLSNCLNAFGLDRVLGSNQGFINADEEFLFDDVVETIPPERFVLEILESVKVNHALIARIKKLKTKGYRFALDDMSMSDENILQFRPLFELVDFAKVDFSITRDIDRLKKKMERLAKFEMTFLAEKVENIDTFEYCKYLGFEYFQGYYFAHPKIMEAKKLEPAHAAIVKLVEKINKHAPVGEIERGFAQNPELTINLLRYINSSHFATRQKISSIPQAVNMLGYGHLLQWLVLHLYSTTKANKYADYILQSVMVRAEIMRSLAERRKLSRAECERAYLVGLLSLLDALLHIPMTQIFKEFSFDQTIVDAVVYHRGELGQLLKITVVVERGNIQEVRMVLNRLKMREGELTMMLSDCYAQVFNRHTPI